MFTLIRFAVRAPILTVCVNVLAIAFIAANWSSIQTWASAQLPGLPKDWAAQLKQHVKQIQIPDVQNLKNIKAMLPEDVRKSLKDAGI